MTAIWQKVVDAFHRYWFLVSSLIIAVLYFLYDKQGQDLQGLKDEVRKNTLENKLQAIQEKSEVSEKHYEDATEDYNTLKRRHGDLLKQLGVGSQDPESNPPAA